MLNNCQNYIVESFILSFVEIILLEKKNTKYHLYELKTM